MAKKKEITWGQFLAQMLGGRPIDYEDVEVK